MSKYFSIQAFGLMIWTVAALVLAAPVHGQTVDEAVRVPVHFADLDIGREPGAKELLRRIQSAATMACGGEPDFRQLGPLADFQRCRKAALANAVAKVDAPMLTAMAGGRPERLAGR